jgi:hypothetical protein
MNFSRDTFTTQFGNSAGIGVTSDWDQWLATTGTLNQVLSYSYRGVNWRTWSPESSTMPTDLGMIVSCKIDFANGNGDDHIVLIAGFLKVQHAAPTINFAEASIQLNDDDDLNVSSGAIISDPANPSDISTLLYNSLNSQILAEADQLGSGDTLTGRESLPDIARITLEAMMGTVSA